MRKNKNPSPKYLCCNNVILLNNVNILLLNRVWSTGQQVYAGPFTKKLTFPQSGLILTKWFIKNENVDCTNICQIQSFIGAAACGEFARFVSNHYNKNTLQYWFENPILKVFAPNHHRAAWWNWNWWGRTKHSFRSFSDPFLFSAHF